ncbi:MAG: hypothetical protein AAFX06_03480 [Planctomycetota bacterium]
MKFSVRSLLALLLLCGFAFPIWIEAQRLSEAELEQLNLKKDLQVALDELESFGPWPEDRKHLAEEYDSIAALTKIAEDRREEIRQKYSQLEPREPDVFSIRGIPSWRPDSKSSAPVGFVMQVPESRDVWLKLAWTKNDGSGNQGRLLDQLSEPPTKTGFTNEGLYQQKLQPGKRTLRYEQLKTEDSALVFEIWLDETRLFQSQFMDSNSKSKGWSSLSGRSQSDFRPKQPLPWLFSSRVEWEPTPGEGFIESELRPTIWLSDQPSEAFQEFAAAEQGDG